MQAARRSERLEARVSPDMKRALARAAAIRGQTLTDFVLSTVAEAARQVIREHELLDLSQRDQTLFARTLLRPPRPRDRLKKAARWYRSQAGG